MSGVYSLSTTVKIIFILPKAREQLNFKLYLSLCVTNCVTFHYYFFPLIIPKSTLQKRYIVYYKSILQKRSVIYYYLSPLIMPKNIL